MLIIYEAPSWIGFEVEVANKVLKKHRKEPKNADLRSLWGRLMLEKMVVGRTLERGRLRAVKVKLYYEQPRKEEPH